MSISGTNGKSTTTRLISHILIVAGRHTGTTTSDGVLVDERMVDEGDWTGPGGAAQILGRSDVEVAVLETARGGIVLKGVGYESNDASVLTNVSSDHLDLQGIHTLPELAEVKATICRITRPDGWVDPQRRRPVRRGGRPPGPGPGRLLLDRGRPPAVVARHVAAGGRAYLLQRGRPGRGRGRASRPPIAEVDRAADHDRRPGPPQRRQRPGRGRRGTGPGGHDRAGPATG